MEKKTNEIVDVYKSKDTVKTCFCIGPDKCQDKDCSLVKEYMRKQNESKSD